MENRNLPMVIPQPVKYHIDSNSQKIPQSLIEAQLLKIRAIQVAINLLRVVSIAVTKSLAKQYPRKKKKFLKNEASKIREKLRKTDAILNSVGDIIENYLCVK